MTMSNAGWQRAFSTLPTNAYVIMNDAVNRIEIRLNATSEGAPDSDVILRVAEVMAALLTVHATENVFEPFREDTC